MYLCIFFNYSLLLLGLVTAHSWINTDTRKSIPGQVFLDFFVSVVKKNQFQLLKLSLY